MADLEPGLNQSLFLQFASQYYYGFKSSMKGSLWPLTSAIYTCPAAAIVAAAVVRIVLDQTVRCLRMSKDDKEDSVSM